MRYPWTLDGRFAKAGRSRWPRDNGRNGHDGVKGHGLDLRPTCAGLRWVGVTPTLTMVTPLFARVTGKTRTTRRRSTPLARRRGERNQTRVLTTVSAATRTGVAAVVAIDDRADELAVLFLRGDEVSFGGLERVGTFLELLTGLHALVGNFLFNCLHG